MMKTHLCAIINLSSKIPAFVAPTPTSLNYVHEFPAFCRRRLRSNVFWNVNTSSPRMSGVNGGIDYDIDLSTLPSSLAKRVRYVQQGPDSPTDFIAAAKEIAESTPQYPAVLPVLVDMLGFNNPVAAGIAIDALACANRSAVPVLLTGVAAFNYAVNAYALRALARIGDPTTMDVCTACAVRGPIPNVRRAACRALGALHFDNTTDATTAFTTLIALADGEPDWGVRYAAIVALEHFYALCLIDASLAEDVLFVLRSTMEGRSHAAKITPSLNPLSRDESSVDPAVSARAAVAFDSLLERFKDLDISPNFHVAENKVSSTMH